jgi:hypothetical protein
MRCKSVRRILSEARYQGGQYPPGVAEHLVGCQGCGEFARANERLDELLDLDHAIEARPGFDTRFFARLSELKVSERESERERATTALGAYRLSEWLQRWRWGFASMSVAAAIALALVLRPNHEPISVSSQVAPLGEQDLALARDLELIEDLDLVRRLQEVEIFETVAQLDLEAIERAHTGSAVGANPDQGVGQ